MNESPAELFKYVPPDRVDILENEQIAFTPPLRFNDAFDMQPTVAHITNRAYLRRAVVKTQDEIPLPKQWSRKERLKFRRDLNRNSFKQMRADPEPLAVKLQKKMITDLNAAGGVLCLCTVKHSPPMWAHYAGNHAGFVMEFDLDAPPFKSLGRLFRVSYSQERPTVDWTNKKMEAGPFIVKSKEWEYESEFRIFRDFRFCKPLPNPKNGKTVYVCPLPKQAVKAVYFGIKMEKATQERIKAAVKGTPIALFQAELPRARFGLEFRQLN